MTTDAAPQPPPSAADLVAWTAAQTASFHSALAAAVTSYAATGVPPKSLTAGGDATADESGKKTRAKKDKDAPKRAPTPYNIFVKERAAVLKEKGFDPKAEHTSKFGVEREVGGQERGSHGGTRGAGAAARMRAGAWRGVPAAKSRLMSAPPPLFPPSTGIDGGQRAPAGGGSGKYGLCCRRTALAVPSPGAPGKQKTRLAPENRAAASQNADPRSHSCLSLPSSPALMAKVADEWKAMSTSEKDAFTSNAIARGKAVAKGSGAHAALPAPATPAAGGGGDADDDEERRRRKAEKRARKEAAKAAALAAGGAPAKKHKHTHE